MGFSRCPLPASRRLLTPRGSIPTPRRIFTPLLHQIDEQKPQPVVHPFGALPQGYTAWANANGIEIRPTWQEYLASNSNKVDEMRQLFVELDTDHTGSLSFSEVSELARRFFDGRKPSESRVKSIFRACGVEGHDAHISFDELLRGAQNMHRAFNAAESTDDLMAVESEASTGSIGIS